MDLPSLQQRLREALRHTDEANIARFLGVQPQRIKQFSLGIVRLKPQLLLRLDAVLTHKVLKGREEELSPRNAFAARMQSWRGRWGQEKKWGTLEMLWRALKARPEAGEKWLPLSFPEDFDRAVHFRAFVLRLDFRYRRYRARSFQWRHTWQSRTRDSLPLGKWLQILISKDNEKRQRNSSGMPDGKTSERLG